MKCLVTTYTAGTDAKLMRYKHCLLFFYKKRKGDDVSNGIKVTYPDDGVERTANIISDEGYFTNSDGSNLGTSIKLNNGLNTIQVTQGSSFDIPNDFKDINAPNYHTHLGFDLSTAKYVKNCSALDMSYNNSIGNISNLKNLGKSVYSLRICECDITGDISSLSGLTNLTALFFDLTGVTGDISSLSGLTNLTTLSLSSTGVTGDISSLSGLTNLTTLSLSSTGVTGDISSVIDKLTKLTRLVLNKNIRISDEQKATLVNRGCNVFIDN